MCYRASSKECLICEMKNTFADCDFDLYKDSLDLDFLSKFYSSLYDYLLHLFKKEKRSVCYILFDEYKYTWRDWFNGNKHQIPLTSAIKHHENLNINKTKNNGCKVVLSDIFR